MKGEMNKYNENMRQMKRNMKKLDEDRKEDQERLMKKLDKNRKAYNEELIKKINELEKK